jgi:hypothetical protein
MVIDPEREDPEKIVPRTPDGHFVKISKLKRQIMLKGAEY